VRPWAAFAVPLDAETTVAGMVVDLLLMLGPASNDAGLAVGDAQAQLAHAAAAFWWGQPQIDHQPGASGGRGAVPRRPGPCGAIDGLLLFLVAAQRHCARSARQSTLRPRSAARLGCHYSNLLLPAPADGGRHREGGRHRQW